ncbi:MAG: LacI family transcriptional regulator [Anaerolineae bacterium]|nr:LacI family transcriptional regulator [Anaerolineae bacterium]
MTAKRPTQADVAERAGVSRGTVSLVLNDRTEGRIPISEATRDRVLQAARELGYSPNPVAQMLANGSNRLIGIFTYETVFPFDKSDFYFPYLRGIQNEAATQDYNVLLFTRNHGSGSQPRIYPDNMNSLRLADGAILLGSTPRREELRRLLEEQYPFVYIGRREVPGYQINWVANDYRRASFEAVSHLLQLGHRRIGFVAGTPLREPQEDKMAGCQQAIDDCAGAELVLVSDDVQSSPTVLIETIHEQGITAMTCDSYGPFYGILDTAIQAGVKVPDDVSVLNLTTADLWPPSVLTPSHVQLNRNKLGQVAAQILMRKIIDQDTEPEQVLVPCKFIPGETTAPPAKKRW